MKQVKEEPAEEDLGVSVMVVPYVDDEDIDGGKTPVIEVTEERPESERKKKRRGPPDLEGGEDYRGRLKVSVQKIVDNALNPFLEKIEELYDPTATSLQIVTLWKPDILLTKLFDQNDLTKFFSDVLNEVLNKNIIQTKTHNTNEVDNGVYTVETLRIQTGNPLIDEAYTKTCLETIDEVVEQPVQTLTVGNMQIIDYNNLPSKHIPKYVHIIAMYRFNIFLKKRSLIKTETSDASKVSPLMPPFLEGDVLHDDSTNPTNEIEDLVKRIAQDERLLSHATPFAHSCFQQINVDLKRRVVADLELYMNPPFHEELIMHIFMDQVSNKNILHLNMGIFLAKGCNFCRKKECKAEDLLIPISPDKPVCPDRQCIKRNLQCHICNKQMSTSKSLARHKYSVHDIETGDSSGLFICIHCGETFSKKWKLNIHERDHEDRKMELVCGYCKKRIRGTVPLKKHIAMVHEAKPQFPCEYCTKIFKRKETLLVHRRIHTGEKPFRCSHCPYASETKGNLKAHQIRKHKENYIQFNPPETQQHILTGEQAYVIDDQSHNVIPEEDTEAPSVAEDQVMAATIVAHPFSDGSFIITSETSPTSIVP